MLPKPVYELLPAVYIVGAVVAFIVTDSLLGHSASVLLLIIALVIFYQRYNFRQLPTRQRMERKAEKYHSVQRRAR